VCFSGGEKRPGCEGSSRCNMLTKRARSRSGRVDEPTNHLDLDMRWSRHNRKALQCVSRVSGFVCGMRAR